MDCQKIEDLISAFIENELPVDLQSQISLHLEHCENCRRLKEKIEDLMYVFPTLEEEVPFFLKNRLYYIPESQETTNERVESRTVYYKWLAAAIGTVVLFLNLFYFTNIYPPAKRILHSVVAQIKTFTVETGAFIEEVKESEGVSLASILSKDSDANELSYPQSEIENENNKKIEKHNLEIEKKIRIKGGNNG